jgi:hypothetical protein
MKYLVELTREYAAKNKPQLEIINYLKADIHRLMIEQKQVKPLAETILQKIRDIEALHPRCKPITVHYTEFTHDRDYNDQKVYCPDLFTIHFKGEKV